MDEVAVGDITVFRVDHQSVEVRESDQLLSDIFITCSFRFFYQRDYFVSEFPEFIPMVLQISLFSFFISPFAFSNISLGLTFMFLFGMHNFDMDSM